MSIDHKAVSTIGNLDLLRIFWRALVIQASWSFDRMQSLGFAYALRPVLEKLYPDRAEFESRLTAHMEYFNTQPYLASFILGAVARLEQERAAGRASSEDISRLKAALMAPLGALGDSFFWGSLMPLSSVIAVAFLITGAWWAPLVFLGFYNSWHLAIRAGVLFRGYQSSGDAMDLMVRYRFTKMARLFKAVTLSVLGGILALVASQRPEYRQAAAIPLLGEAGIGLAITVAMASLLWRGGSPIKLMLGLALLCLALAYAGVA